MNPYLVLGINEASDDAGVRSAYLNLIRRFPPDHNPGVFQSISNAYETVNTENKRYAYRLFNLKPYAESPMDVFSPLVAIPANRKPLPFDTMKEFLRRC
jgi:DnaJ-class molecular chaperone